jgi:hypothetical protein
LPIPERSTGREETSNAAPSGKLEKRLTSTRRLEKRRPKAEAGTDCARQVAPLGAQIDPLYAALTTCNVCNDRSGRHSFLVVPDAVTEAAIVTLGSASIRVREMTRPIRALRPRLS